jgi:alpha-N-arabinofuranosidase
MKIVFPLLLSVLVLGATVRATEFHVAISGNDANPGTSESPFRTIQHAADIAQAGDVITVHRGIYRERVSPQRGGVSDEKRIVYQAAPGETVEITGSEAIKNWVKISDDVWKVTLPNSFFGKFNPYSDLIHGDWFMDKGRAHHTGAVYLNGDWLTEAATIDDVMKPQGAAALWFGKVDQQNTTIWAQFKGVDPNAQSVEINVRQTVFYPKKTGINFITVRRFTLEHAATPWAPPTAEQIGVIGPHWSKGWIIENNVIRYSTCSGISLGKYGDQYDNTSANTAEGYVATIRRALADGWSKENIGHHIVRNNVISHCEQTGIVGSLGAVFSTITDNTIYDIHVRRLFTGAEMAGIKLHGAIDVTIHHNHIYHTCLGLWLDWMAQGTRVSDNLFHDNDADVFVEVDHGPFLMDNNFFLSSVSLVSRSQGGAYVHDLFAGAINSNAYDARQTPFLKPHSTQIGGFHDNPRGDDRFYNNIFVGHSGLANYDEVALPVWISGNVFLKGTVPSKQEKDPLSEPGFDPALKLTGGKDGYYLEINLDKSWAKQKRQLITSELLGKAAIPDERFENADGSSIRIDRDYLGNVRGENPFPGPLEISKSGTERFKVWP